MKTKLHILKTLWVFLMVLSSVWGWGQVLLTEDFNYSIGSNLTSNGWIVHSGGTTSPIDVTNGLTFPGYVGSGIGGAANIDNTGQDVNKIFAPQTGTVYVSFMLKTSDTANSTSTGYFLHLSENPLASNSPFVARLFVNSSGTGLALSDGNFSGTYVPITANTTYLVVIKRVFGGQTSLFVFDSLPSAEPSVPNMSYPTSTTIQVDNIGSIALRQYSSFQRQIVDGIRVATSWNSIFPTSTSTTTTTWNSTTNTWSNGNPSSTVDAIINSSYITSASTPGFTAKNITIQNGGTLEITEGNTVSAVDVTVENGGNLIQRGDGVAINAINNGVLAYTGVFKVNKTATSAVDKYAFWSSPIASQNLANMYTGVSSSFFITEYNSSNDTFIVSSTANGATPGKGYSIKTPGINSVAATAVSFTGNPNNGNVTFPLVQPTATPLSYGYNLVGNPYPSDLDLTKFYNDGSNSGTVNTSKISSTVYFWDTSSTASGNNPGYATANIAGLTVTWSSAPNAVLPSGNVAKVGQGFIVKASSSATLNFTNAMRAAGTATFFNKNNTAGEGKYWLKLSSAYNTNNTIAVTYNAAASNAYDVYDSKAMGLGTDALYTIADTEKVVIQGRAGFTLSDVVPVGTKHQNAGNFTLALVQKEGIFDNGQVIYLHDKQLNTYINLQNQSYTFAASAGELTNRFEIVYTMGVLSTQEATKAEFEIYKEGDHFVIRNSKKIESVEVYDAAGRKIVMLAPNALSAEIRLEAKGMYIVKAVSEGKEFSKKISK